MRRRITGILLVLLCWTALATRAQPGMEENPGYFPIELLDILAAEDVSVEVNLRGAMLRMISAFVGDEDPEFARLVAGLDAVHVRSGEIDPAGSARVRERIRSGQEWLEEHGWLAMVRVQDGEEEVFIYTREDGNELVGLAILALDSSEATAINLIGKIDPQEIGRLAAGFDIGNLDELEEAILREESQ